MGLIGIIIIIVLAVENTNKNKEIAFLRSKLKGGDYTFCPKCGYNFGNKTNEKTILEQDIKAGTKNEKTIINNNIKTNYSKPINKNNAILITGSILVILSAITFLTTTWNYTGNIFKIIILFLMFLTFEGISVLANSKDLHQTSKAFHYIALSYLPIILFAMPALHLLGNLISYNNIGKNTYFTLCSIIITLIYYKDNKKNKSILTILGSITFSILSFLFFTAIFTTNTSCFLLSLLTYIMIICLLYYHNIFLFNKETHYKIAQTLFISSTAIVIYYNPIKLLISKATTATIMTNFIMIINSHIYLNKIRQEKEIYKILFPLLMIITFLNISSLFEPFVIKQIIILTAVIITYLCDIINNKEISIYTIYENLIFMIILHIFTIFSNENYIIPTYLLAITETGLIWLSYLNTKEKEGTSLLGTIGIIISAFNLILEINSNMILVEFISIILISLAQIVKSKDIKNSFNTIGYISYILTTIFYYEATIIQALSLTLFIIISFINKLQKNYEGRIISYIFFNQLIITLLLILKIQDSNVYALTIPFGTIIITLLELSIPELKNKTNMTYLIVSYIISMIVLALNNTSIFNYIYLIIINMSYLMYMSENELKNTEYKLPILLSLIPYTYSKILVINTINYMYSVSLLLIAAMIYLSSNKKHPIYYIMFYIYAFTHIVVFNDINYIKYTILLIGTTIIYHSEKQFKDLYKTLIYILSYLIIKEMIIDFNLTELTFITHGLLLIMTTLICRDIIKKYMPEYKVLLYIAYILINFNSLNSYTSQPDAVFYLLFLTTLVMASYLLKYGPEFIVSLASILINTFILTKTFWASIPWWIYILLIGTILITFAMNNEMNNEKNKEQIKKLKEHLDL